MHRRHADARGAGAALPDRRVVVYGINLKEDESVVAAFLRRQDYSLNILLDHDGKVGDAYGAVAIPQTVIVGVDGRIRAVHVGDSEHFHETLEAGIQAALEAVTPVNDNCHPIPRMPANNEFRFDE